MQNMPRKKISFHAAGTKSPAFVFFYFATPLQTFKWLEILLQGKDIIENSVLGPTPLKLFFLLSIKSLHGRWCFTEFPEPSHRY